MPQPRGCGADASVLVIEAVSDFKSSSSVADTWLRRAFLFFFLLRPSSTCKERLCFCRPTLCNNQAETLFQHHRHLSTRCPNTPDKIGILKIPKQLMSKLHDKRKVDDDKIVLRRKKSLTFDKCYKYVVLKW